MGERRNLCVLVAETVGGPSREDTSDAIEVQRAIDRCVHRVDRAIEAHGGRPRRRDELSVLAGFEKPDAAILAACELFERTQSLPPLRGNRLTVRIGIHYGPIDAAETMTGEGERVAFRLARAARGGEALASGAAVMLLSTATRHFARPESTARSGLETLEWPLYAVFRQPESVVSLPPATRLLQRLRIRHQEDNFFIGEQGSALLFGRELGNDVVIMDPRASRHHARIERRRSGFVLIDFSTNGCYVVEEGGREHCVKGGELPLIGPGRIGCGFSASEVERDLVFFEII